MELTLDDFRKLNPHYSAASDDTLAKYLHEKYAPEQPFNKFAKLVGYDDPNAPGDFSRGATAAWEGTKQTGYGLLAAAGSAGETAFGQGGISTGIKQAGLEGYREKQKVLEENASETDDITTAWDRAKQGDLGALVDWAQYGLGYAGAQGLQMLATAGVGSIAANAGAKAVAGEVVEKLVAKEVTKLAATGLTGEALTQEATKLVADKIGQIGAMSVMGAQSFGMEGGDIGGDLADRADKEGRQLTGDELAKGFGMTLGAGAIDLVGDKFGLDVLTGKSSLFKAAQSAKGLTGKAGRAAFGAVAAAPVEGATEYAQTLMEESGKGNDPFSEASRTQAINAAGLGAISGAAFGVGGGLLSKHVEPIKKQQDEGMREIAGANNVDDMIAGMEKATSWNAALPELVFDKSGNSYNKADLLRGFMGQGADRQAAEDYISRIVGSESPEKAAVDLSAYRELQARNLALREFPNPLDRPEQPGETFQNDFAFDGSIPLESNPGINAGPTSWEEADLANSVAQEKSLTTQQIEARKRLNALRNQANSQATTPEQQTQPTASVQPQKGRVSPQVGAAGLVDQAPGFVATHTLFGEPVQQIGENLYQNADGVEVDDEYQQAEPIHASDNAGSRAAVNHAAASQDSGAGATGGRVDKPVEPGSGGAVSRGAGGNAGGLPGPNSAGDAVDRGALDSRILTMSKGGFLMTKNREFMQQNPSATQEQKNAFGNTLRDNYDTLLAQAKNVLRQNQDESKKSGAESFRPFADEAKRLPVDIAFKHEAVLDRLQSSENDNQKENAKEVFLKSHEKNKYVFDGEQESGLAGLVGDAQRANKGPSVIENNDSKNSKNNDNKNNFFESKNRNIQEALALQDDEEAVLISRKQEISKAIADEIIRQQKLSDKARREGKRQPKESNRKALAKRFGIDSKGWGPFDMAFGHGLNAMTQKKLNMDGSRATDAEIVEAVVKYIDSINKSSLSNDQSQNQAPQAPAAEEALNANASNGVSPTTSPQGQGQLVKNGAADQVQEVSSGVGEEKADVKAWREEQENPPTPDNKAEGLQKPESPVTDNATQPETITHENVKENEPNGKEDQSNDLISIFAKLPKSGAIPKKLQAEVDANPRAELIRNIQKHWADVLADHGFEEQHGTKGRLTNTVEIKC